MSKSKSSKKTTAKKYDQNKTLKGILEVTRSGMGYVVIANGTGDVLVRPGSFGTALNGDTVVVKIIKESSITGKKEGRITDVTHRKQTEFAGHIQLSTNFAFFVPDSDKPMPDVFIPLDKLKGAKNKQRVFVKLVQWEKSDKKPVGEVISLIMEETQNDTAMKKLLTEAGFSLTFPEEVIEASERLPHILDKAEISNRKDYRKTTTFTIDPIDAKDFDDAISIKKLTKGNWEIGVHIADVSYYVEPNTALDEEAYKRATSVYLPDRVNPMLPEVISNELCSLRPNEDKFTFSVIFKMNEKGVIKETWMGKTVIHSNHRFSYEDVQEILEEKENPAKEPVFKEEIFLLNTIAQIFRKERFSKGAINFSSQEVRFKLDENAKPIGIMIKESKEAHQLIEEFMLLANKAVAEFVGKTLVADKEVPFPYRVHDQPDEDKLAPFIEFAKKYGHRFQTSTPQLISASFNEMLQDVKGKPEQHVLEQLGIRTMSKAIYTTKNIGHYGLAFDYYCHFTSPIRRYPDVLVHRVLLSLLEQKPLIDKKMEEKCKNCSERERAAMDCERASNKYKQVEFLKDHLGEVFDGVVSGVASFGLFVETIAHKCEGLVSIIGLNDYDEFRHIESDYSLVGKRSGRRFRIGDAIKIKVIAANLDKRQLDYEWVLEGVTNNKSKTTKESRSPKEPKAIKESKKLDAKPKEKTTTTRKTKKPKE